MSDVISLNQITQSRYAVQVNTNGEESFSCYLSADDFLREVGHGICQPSLQTLGKVTDGLSESA